MRRVPKTPWGWLNKWRAYLDGLKFRYKMLALTMSCVLFVGMVAIIGNQLSLNRYTHMLHQQTSVSMSLFTQRIRFEMEAMEEISDAIALDSAIQEEVATLDRAGVQGMEQYQARYRITQFLYRYLEPEILCITVMPLMSGAVRCGLDSSAEQETVIALGRQTSEGKNGAVFWMDSGRKDGSVLLFREIRKKNDPGFLSTLGFLVMRIDYEKLVRQAWADVDALKNQKLAILGDGGDVFFSNFESDATPDSFALKNGQKYDVRTVSGQKYFITHFGLESTDPPLAILSGLPYNDVFSTIHFTRIYTFLSMLLAILLSILLAGLTVKSIVQKLLTSQAQLRNLEQQIQPHFLYNTLETVNWFAKRHGEQHIPTIIDALSDLLRNNLAVNEDVVPLEKELAALRSYATIQKIRYTDMLQIAIDVAPETLNTSLPKLTLQPLVENAIFHSMEENLDGCYIQISSRVEGDVAIVLVTNNGSHIDENILEKLKNHTIIPKGHGIGLLNINARIQMLFGKEYGLRFSNGDNNATVAVHLPWKRAKNR